MYGLTFLLIATFYLTKTENRTKKSLSSSHTIAFGKGAIFAKNQIFCKKMLASAKLRGSWHQTVYFLKLHMYLYLRAKFQVSSITLTGFRRGNFIRPQLQNEPLKIMV